MGTKQDHKMPFMNQEKLLKKMAEEFLHNMWLQQQSFEDQNTQKFSVLVAAQMFGSGKTHLGAHFLESFTSLLEKNAQWKENLFNLYGQSLVDRLKDAQYIQLSLENIKSHIPIYGLQISLSVFVYSKLYSLCNTEQRQVADKEFILPVASYPLTDILSYFRSKFAKTFFLHFDEVDIVTIEKYFDGEIHSYTGITAIQKYYDLWNFVHTNVIEKGIPVYFSGRSFYLWLIGKSLFKHFPNSKISSPNAGRAFYCELESLSESTIYEILSKIYKNWSKEECSDWAKILYRYTSGVPRLVQVVINKYIKKGNTSKDINEMLNVLECSGLSMELDLSNNISAEMKNTFWDLVSIAVAGFPIRPLNLFVDPENWSNIENFDEFKEITLDKSTVQVPPIIMGELVRVMNFYTTSSDRDTSYLILPELCIEYMAKHYTSERQRYLHLRHVMSIDQDLEKSTGITMERAFRRYFMLHTSVWKGAVNNGLTTETSFNWSMVLPFLKNSYLSKKVLPDLVTICHFPKIMWNTELVEKWDSKRRQRLQNYMKMIFNDRLDRGYPCVNGADWKFLLQHMEENILYWPASKSSSGDAHFLYDKALSGILSIQLKQTEINVSTLVAEYLKSKPCVNCQFIFLILPLKIFVDVPKFIDRSDLDYEGNAEKLIHVKDENDKLLAYQYEPGFTFRITAAAKKQLEIYCRNGMGNGKDALTDIPWTVPDNSQIIILTSDGMIRLFSERVFQLIDSGDVETFVRKGRKRSLEGAKVGSSPKRDRKI